MKSHNLLINIKKPTVQNQKYFVYQNKKYTINFDLLKQNCTYFYQNQNEFCDKDNINLIEEDEIGIILTEESIHSFIAACQNESSEVSPSSVFPLQYLSYKYDYPALKAITDDFIATYSQELIFEKLLFNNDKSEYLKEGPFFDTRKEEEYISKHMILFVILMNF